MTRFEQTGTIVDVYPDHFWVRVADATHIRVDLPQHADKPTVGQKATVAVEVY